MSYYDVFIENINRGKQGLNIGLPHGFDRLTEYIPNIQQGNYYSIGGEKGTGKTALTDCMFLYNPIEWYLENEKETDIKLEIIYWSMEISLANKLAKYATLKIFKKFKVVTDINLLLSKGKNRIDSTLYEYCISLKKDFERLEDIVTIFDEPMNPTGVHKYLSKYYKDRGTYEQIDEYRKRYKPTNPNLYTISISDHIGLTKGEEGYRTNKEKIDKLSEYYRYHRNIHNLIPVAVAQFNRSLATSERESKVKTPNKNGANLRPQESDWKDTGNIGEDANVMIGLFSPHRYEIPVFDKYDVSSLEDRFRSINIVKNRDGSPDAAVGLSYLGEIGLFKELPKADDMMIKSKETGKNFYQTINDIKKYVGEDNSEGKQNSLF